MHKDEELTEDVSQVLGVRLALIELEMPSSCGPMICTPFSQYTYVFALADICGAIRHVFCLIAVVILWE